MDTLSFTSLAELVCNGDKSLVQSATQQSAHDDLESYLGKAADYDENSPLLFRPGPLMAMIAVAVWTLTVVRELQASLCLIDAVRQLPSIAPLGSAEARKQGVFAELHPESNEVVIVGMSRAHKGVILLLQLLRMGSACMLGYIGAVFLVRTWSITEVRPERRSRWRPCAASVRAVAVCAAPLA
jgi:hypothetical protein